MTEIIRIPNIENYTQEIIDGALILTPKKVYITENEINITCLRHSVIMECQIKKDEEIISTNTKYRTVLIDIWKFMPVQKIFQTTTFNFKLTNENGLRGYTWCDDIKMSFQSKDAANTFKEIINMVRVNGLSMNITIKLKTNKWIYFKMDQA
jgi:hypothetical protein